MSDKHLGGKSTVDVSFVEEEVDYSLFYKPQKQGEVDHLRGKPARESEGEVRRRGSSAKGGGLTGG